MRRLLRTANEKEDEAKCPIPSNYLAPPAYYWGALWRLYPHSPKEGDVENANLAKVLSVWDLIAYGIGSTVGAGIFVVTGVVAREKAGLAIHNQQAVLPFLLKFDRNNHAEKTYNTTILCRPSHRFVISLCRFCLPYVCVLLRRVCSTHTSLWLCLHICLCDCGRDNWLAVRTLQERFIRRLSCSSRLCNHKPLTLIMCYCCNT